MRRKIAITLCGLFAACATTTEQAERPPTKDVDWRATPPSGGPVPPLEAPVPKRTVLQNGLTMMTVNKPKLPLVSIGVIIRSGSADDPKDLPGLAGFVGEMLRAGTKTRSAAELAEEVETLGAALQVNVDEDSTAIYLTTLESNFDELLEVVSDVLQNPAFSTTEIEKVRRRRLATLAQATDNPSYVAGREFRRSVFGEHPYGHMVLGDAASLTKINRDDLLDHYRQHFGPTNAAVIIVGSLSHKDAGRAVSDRLGSWSGKVQESPVPGAPELHPPQVILVARPQAPQSQLRIGHLGVSRSNPDYFSLVLANSILGGEFNSRINMNLREDKGYTYGARSYFDFMQGPGPFVVATGVETQFTAPAIKEVLKEIVTFRQENVTQQELAAARSRYTLSLPGYFQTVDDISGMIANIYLYGLPLDYYQRLPEKLQAVGIADVRRVAEKYLKPDAVSIIVVGDPKRAYPALEQLERGPIRTVDEQGNPVPSPAKESGGSRVGDEVSGD